MSSSALARLPFLHGAPPATIAAVKRVLRPLSVTAGTTLFRTGDAGDTCYLVQRGALRVLTSPNGELLATVGAGAFVGELAVLLDEPRSATVIAEEDSKLLALSRRDLDGLIQAHPALATAMSRELGRRIVQTNRLVATSASARRSVVWPASFVAPVAAAVRSHHNVGVAAIAGGSLGALPDGVARVKAPHYGAGDAALDTVLLGAGEAPSARAATAVAQADHVLCFGAAPAWLSDAAPEQRLVRVDGVERAARWATGRAIGLALSSGGSKAVAHMGVILALQNAGVAVDAVAGSSGGAIAAVALGFDKDEAWGRRCVADLAKLTHWRRLDVNVPPRSGLSKGKRLRAAFDRWGLDVDLADAPIPIRLVASDVATGATVVIGAGATADAIRASLSIPGVFDPWRVDGKTLIDGAVSNPLPTDVLRAAGAGIVIASNVAGQATEIDVAARTPGLGQIMSRVLNTMERARISALLPLADVVIRPRVNAGSTFDFSNTDDLIAAGRAAADARVDDIRSLIGAASSVDGDAAHNR